MKRWNHCRPAVLRVAAIAMAVASAGTAWSQIPAGYTCGDGLEGRLYASPSINATPDRKAASGGLITDVTKDVPNWTTDLPNPPFARATAKEHYFDQWIGGFMPSADGDYVFTIKGDDGVRIWLSDKPIDLANPGAPTPVTKQGADAPSDSWVEQGTTAYDTKPIHLTKGKMEYVLYEHYQNGGGAASILQVNGNDPDKKDFCAPPASLKLGTLTGTVKDSKGTGVPANVKISGAAAGLVSTDDSGAFNALLPPGDYTLQAFAKDLTQDVTGDPVKATVTQDKTVTASLTVTVSPVPNFTIDDQNSNWKFLKEPTVQNKVPTPFDPAVITNPTFNDSAWMDQDPTKRSNADTAAGVIITGNYWLRGKFKLGTGSIPADFPVDRPSLMYNFDVDARSNGIWVNGVPIGARPEGDTPANNTFLIPAGVLKKGADNIIVIRGENGGGDMGLGPSPIHIRALGAASGTVQVVSSGVDVSMGGTGTGTTLTLVDKSGKTVDSTTTMLPGDGYFMNVTPGTYTLQASGPLVDAGTQVTFDVAAGGTASVTLPTVASKGLGNAFLTAGSPWKTLPSADPADLKPTQIDFDDSKWQTVTFLPGDLKNGDQGLTGFEDNKDDWLRLKFTVPAEWAKTGRDLVVDEFNVVQSDTTYFNGQKIGSSDSGTRSYVIPKGIVKFGADNVLAILVHNTGGGAGITDRTRVPRIHVQAGTATPSLKLGDVNGDGKVNIADATMILQFAVKLKTPTADQLKTADINHDGVIDIKDVTLLLKAIVSGTVDQLQ